MSEKRLNEIAAEFQREMKKLGLGVSIQAGDGPAVDVTAWFCPDCDEKRKDAVVPCPECGSEKDAVLR